MKEESQPNPHPSATDTPQIPPLSGASSDTGGTNGLSSPGLEGASSSGEKSTSQGGDVLDFDQATLEGVVEMKPPPPNPWWHDALEISGVIGLIIFFFASVVLVKKILPVSKKKRTYLSIKDFPPGIQRGIGYSTVLYGISFVLGFASTVYHLHINEGMVNYFKNMGLGKFFGVSHAHIFGLTTSFLIVGIPFTLKYPTNKIYQWFLPLGLTMVFVDVFGWWGVRFIGARFELISIVAGLTFGGLYLIMLIGLVVPFKDIKLNIEFEDDDLPMW